MLATSETYSHFHTLKHFCPIAFILHISFEGVYYGMRYLIDHPLTILSLGFSFERVLKQKSRAVNRGTQFIIRLDSLWTWHHDMTPSTNWAKKELRDTLCQKRLLCIWTLLILSLMEKGSSGSIVSIQQRVSIYLMTSDGGTEGQLQRTFCVVD